MLKIVRGEEVKNKVVPGTLLAHIANKKYNPNRDPEYDTVDYWCVYLGEHTKKEYNEYVKKQKQELRDCGFTLRDCADLIEDYEAFSKKSKIYKFNTGSVDFEIKNTSYNLDEEGYFYIISDTDKKIIKARIFGKIYDKLMAE